MTKNSYPRVVSKEPQIIVYDTSRGFSRFIKSRFEEQFDVISLNSPQEIKKYKIEQIDVLLFIVNSGVDVLLFSNLVATSRKVFLGVAAKHLENRFVEHTNVITVDLELPKKELFDYINHHLQIAN